MRTNQLGALLALIASFACSPQDSPSRSPSGPDTPARLIADTPVVTVAGNRFIAPAGWSLVVRGPATILEPPEPGSRVLLVDVQAANADAALALAWKLHGSAGAWPLLRSSDAPPSDGWTHVRTYEYRTSPNEGRQVQALALFANDTWTVVIIDMERAVGERRGAQVSTILSRLVAKGGTRESFGGRQANQLDQARIAELVEFIERGQSQLGVPGVSVGLIQGGKVIFAGGFGVRELDEPARVDADTKYLIASNTKALTTLMLAKLVDQGELDWEAPASGVLPGFALGDEQTTAQVRVKHLVCACTGLPRRDFEQLFEFDGVGPADILTRLAATQPTSELGELFQYSNTLAAAAGFLGGHVAYPEWALDQAYDHAMRTLVFEPLGMHDTTFSFARGQRDNYAAAHARDIDGMVQQATAIHHLIRPVRPAGGAWSTVNDMLEYVQMELANGKLANGQPYISSDALLARRAPQIQITPDVSYGMGLMIDTSHDVMIVHHGGDIFGFHSDMMWLPEHGVGAVVLTNGEPGWLISEMFSRKLLEVLFDGRPEADAELTAMGKRYLEQLAAERELLTAPASAEHAFELAAHYSNAALGHVRVDRHDGKTHFDFGEWSSEVASRENPDGSVSFLTMAPGFLGLEFVAGSPSAGSRTLTLRDAQHEYVLEEVPRLTGSAPLGSPEPARPSPRFVVPRR